MAGASLLTLIDDIATILDDVSLMTKVAVKKTAGVLGDDLALNAQQVSGVKADRELPVVWAVAKGSLRNKAILVPAALLIIAITLGSVAGTPFLQQVAVLVGIALIMTVGVYGLVAGIVKLDDLGLYLSQRSAAPAQAVGNAIVLVAPYLMKSLSVIGTAAMFMVGGGILAHGLPAVHHGIEALAHFAADLPSVGTILGPLSETALNAVIGVLAGAVVLAGVKAFGMLKRRVA
ncbi:DUF808 family protein [Litchfieldella rifensis]|uniref:DUF808 family protein n=1 Tax=Litchfieldella rifensis TaxID=762643 RepID=A0ABV7LUD5_9GAMM